MQGNLLKYIYSRKLYKSITNKNSMGLSMQIHKKMYIQTWSLVHTTRGYIYSVLLMYGHVGKI